MPRRELRLQKKIVAAIGLNGGMGRICVQNHPFTIVGDPDVYGIFGSNGRMFQLEVKEEGEEPTDIQQFRMAQWKSVGAATLVVYSVEEALSFLQKNCR